MAAPRLADQLEFIASAPDPKAESYYFEHTVNRITPNAPAEHQVLGVVVTLEEGHANKLHAALHKDRKANKADRGAPTMDIKSVTILCDTLEVLSPTCIPEADVTIHCRRILFGPKGEIDTSPLDWLLPRARDANATGGDGETGSNGRHAGKLSVFCDGVLLTSGKAITGTRLKANGGAGQDAGKGKHGTDGTSRESRTGDDWSAYATGLGTTKFKTKFDPPAYYYDAKINMLEIIPAKHKTWGVDSAPTSGTDARPPGVPGDGGNAGLLTTNKADLVNSFEANAGADGGQAADVRGGHAGTPTKSARYTMTCYYNLFDEDNGRIDYDSRSTVDTKAGASHTAKASVNGPGKRPAPVLVGAPQGWLHPRLLRHMLMVIRDLYLGNARDRVGELLAAYEATLSQPCPTDNAAFGWTADSAPEWYASAAEVASLRQRLLRQEDYFGNPAGYAPLLSLQSALRAYDLEAKTALRTLLLTRLVASKTRAQTNAATACEAAVNLLNENSAKIASEMVKAKDTLASLDAAADEVERDLSQAQTDLLKLHDRLMVAAANDLAQKALIKAAVNVGAALLQVVPVGQPVLGSIGKLGSVLAENYGKDPAVTVKKAGDAVGEAIKKSKDAKSEAEKAMKEALKQAKDEGKSAEELEAIRNKRPVEWSKAAAGIGPAMGYMSQAITALQVPKAELDAEIDRLKAKSDDWAKIAEQMRDLNEKKARLFTDIAKSVQRIAEGYARASNNASAVVTLNGQKGVSLAAVNPAATQFMADMDQRARIALTTNLYYLVRAYETTAFKPADVNWAVGEVFNKIETLLNVNKDKDVQTVLAETKVLEPIFEGNLTTLLGRLLKDDLLTGGIMPLELSIGPNQPVALAELNDHRRTRIDPVYRALVQPKQQRALIARVELDKLEFVAPPTSGKCVVTLTVGDSGVVRIDEHLYGVRRDAPTVWRWSYGFDLKKLKPELPSLSSVDLLNTLLKDTDQGLRQKLSLPPVWADLDLEITFSDLPPRTPPPKIAALTLQFGVDSTATKQGQVVLDVRNSETTAELVLNRPDLGARKDGQGDFWRVFGRGSKVELGTILNPAWTVDRWEVDGVSKGSDRTLTVDLKQDTVVAVFYKAKEAAKPILRRWGS